MNKLLILISIFLIVSCSPGKLIKTGYLVGVDDYGKNEIKIEHFETSDSVDIWIEKETKLQFNTHGLISKEPPFWEFNNDEFYIYVEKKELRKSTNGKNKWKKIK